MISLDGELNAFGTQLSMTTHELENWRYTERSCLTDKSEFYQCLDYADYVDLN